MSSNENLFTGPVGHKKADWRNKPTGYTTEEHMTSGKEDINEYTKPFPVSL